MKNYFQSQEFIEKKKINIIDNNIIEFSRKHKEIASNIKNLIGERNSVSQEYYKAKINLIEKKKKKLELDERLWEVDSSLAAQKKINLGLIRKDKTVARRFLYSNETKDLRNYADVFALFNNLIFKEILFHEKYYFAQMLNNFDQFESKNSEAVTEFHHALADLSSNLNDIESYTVKS
jgi:hypothetical protein